MGNCSGAQDPKSLCLTIFDTFKIITSTCSVKNPQTLEASKVQHLFSARSDVIPTWVGELQPRPRLAPGFGFGGGARCCRLEPQQRDEKHHHDHRVHRRRSSGPDCTCSRQGCSKNQHHREEGPSDRLHHTQAADRRRNEKQEGDDTLC